MNTTIGNGKLIILIEKEYDLSGDLDLRDTGITQLPDTLSVCHHIYLEGTHITHIPARALASGIRSTAAPKHTKCWKCSWWCSWWYPYG